jgi:uncharacterized RDD family membrane protein YckC
VVAGLVDTVIVAGGFVVLILIAVAGGQIHLAADPVTGNTSIAPLGGLIVGISVLGMVALLFGYELLNGGDRGQTLGKRAMNIACRDGQTGGPISYPRAAGRYLVRFVGIFIPFGGWVDLLWPLWDGQRQTLHDKAAGTVVVQLTMTPPGPQVRWDTPMVGDRVG